MAFDARTSLQKAAASMAAASMLAACTVACPETDLGKAVSYGNEFVVFGSPAQQNRWIENARLSLFLQERIQSGGIVKLARKYGLQCVARPTPESCTDCYICTGMVVAEVPDIGGTFGGGICGSDGTVAIRAEVGPGAATASMTYWTPRERRRRAVD
jgi:hypothetical protein